MTAQLVVTLSMVGFLAGMISGLVGIGGGLIIIPALVFFLGFSQQQAQGTSLGLLLLPVGILAVMNYYQKGYVDVKVVLIMSVAFVAGGWVGSRIALQLREDTIKKIFAVFLFYSAVRMLGWDRMFIGWVRDLFK